MNFFLDDEIDVYFAEPRRCAAHPEIVISSPDGQFDGLCPKCEQACDEDAAAGCAVDCPGCGDCREDAPEGRRG